MRIFINFIFVIILISVVTVSNSKNKITYSLENGQSVQINPSNIEEKIIYNNSPFTYFEIKKNSILYGIDIDF